MEHIESHDRWGNPIVELYDDNRTEVDNSCAERDKLVALVARMALELGFFAGIGKHEDKPGEVWEDDWRNIIFIDLPTGQVSWHIHDSELPMFDFLPEYKKKWDGHDTEEKYRRVVEMLQGYKFYNQ